MYHSEKNVSVTSTKICFKLVSYQTQCFQYKKLMFINNYLTFILTLNDIIIGSRKFVSKDARFEIDLHCL